MKDLPCVEDASRDPDIPNGTTVPRRYTPAEGSAWIERQWGRLELSQGISLAIADAGSGEALGAAVLMVRPQRGSASIGYWVIERARRQRRATRAVALLSRWALTDAGLRRVEAVVAVGNAASQRVVEANGFQREGHLRSYLSFEDRRADAVMYSLLPADFGNE